METIKMTPEDKQKAIEDHKVVYLTPAEHTCPYCGEKFVWKDGIEICPKCHAEVVGISRITGYMSFDTRFCESKVHEREDRLDHSANHNPSYKDN